MIYCDAAFFPCWADSQRYQLVLCLLLQIYRVFGDNQEYETIRLNETLAAYGDDSRVRTFTSDVFMCHLCAEQD